MTCGAPGHHLTYSPTSNFQYTYYPIPYPIYQSGFAYAFPPSYATALTHAAGGAENVGAQGVKANLRSSSAGVTPHAVAALEYVKNSNSNDICGRTTKAYLETLVNGGTDEEALTAAADSYKADYAAGLTPAVGSECEAANTAFQSAYGKGEDPIFAAAQAFMAKTPAQGNPCASAGKVFFNAVSDGASVDEANIAAAKTFAKALSSSQLVDPACTAASRAVLESTVNKAFPEFATAMEAFLASALTTGVTFDPICWKAADTYLDAYAAGANELDSILAAGETMLNEFTTTGANIPADSPCAVAAMAYAEDFVTSSPLNAAMKAFLSKMISTGNTYADQACTNAAQTYM